MPVDAVSDVNEFLVTLKQLEKRTKSGVTTLVLVSPASAWAPAWVEKASERLAGLKSRNSFVRVAFVADAATCWRIASELEALESKGVTTVNVAPWQDSTLQQWLDDVGFAGIQEGDRRRIAEVTGNWPVPLKVLRERCAGELLQWSWVLDELEKELDTSGRFGTFDAAELFGVQPAEAKSLLTDLAELDEASAEDLDGLTAGLPLESVEHILRWGASLSFVRHAGGGRYRVDPLLGRMLMAERRAPA